MNRIQEQFRRNRRKMHGLLAVVIVVTFLVVYLAEYDLIGSTEFFVSFIGIIILSVWFYRKYWSCPSCEKPLGKFYIGLKNPKHCPQCGTRLIPEK